MLQHPPEIHPPEFDALVCQRSRNVPPIKAHPRIGNTALSFLAG